MRRILPLMLLVTATFVARAQKDSATYTNGDLPTEYQAFISTADESFNCTDTLRVSITPGNNVTSVDVFYQMEALQPAGGWVSEQGSYLELVNTNIKEPAVTLGDQNWDSSGVFSYVRTGLTFANGVSASGDLDFFLHAFRTFGQFPVCNSAIQKVVNGSWKIVVHHSPAPTCLPPSGLSTIAIGSDNADLIWNSGGATNWQFEYGPAGFTPGTGTIVSAVTNPFNLAGLTPNTLIDVYVRDSCGVGDVSAWDGPLSFLTLCGTFNAPFTESFDGVDWASGFGAANFGDQISPCWIRPAGGNPNFSTRTGGTVSGGTGPLADNSGGGNYIYTEASGSAGAGEITTPAIFIPTTLPQPGLEFYYHMYGTGIDSLYVEVDNGSGFTQIFSIVGEVQTNNADAWIPTSIPLTAYSGDTIVIKLVGVNNAFAGDISIDDLSVKTITCGTPSGLTLSNATTTSLDVSWTSGGASQALIGYRPAVAGGPFTYVTPSGNPFTLSGLLSGTLYEVQIRDSCAAGDVSPWVGPLALATLCSFETAPWQENFDSPNWTSGAGGANAGNLIDLCWERPSVNNPNFGTRTGATNSAGTGPVTDFSGNGKYIYTEASGAPGVGEITTVDVYIPLTVTNPALFFRSHLFGGGVDSLWVEISANSGPFTQVYSLVGAQQASEVDPWELNKVDLTSNSGDTVRIKFLASNSGFTGDIAIDDVAILPVTCPEPTALMVDIRTTNSLTISWTTGGATNWLVGYRVSGAAGAVNIVSATTNPYTITGLSPDTEYELFVKDSCAAGDVSLWQGPVLGATRCAPFLAPFIEGFDGGDWVPGQFNGLNTGNAISSCWDRPTELGPNFGSWSGGTQSAGTGPSGGNLGSAGFIYTEGSGGAIGAGEITTPDIIVNSSFLNPELSFYYHMFGADVDSLIVQIDSGLGFNNNVLVLTGQQQFANTDPWIYFTYDLASYLGDTIRIRFIGVNTGFAGDIAIDDVVVDDAPLCPKPFNIVVVNTLGNSIELSWTTGGAADWQIEYGPPGFTLGTGTLVAANSNPFIVTGLNANTDYEFYVRDSCAVGQVSEWSDPIISTTTCGVLAIPYSENFDGPEWVTGGGALNTGTQVSPCWTRPTGQNPDFGVGTGATPSAGTGPSADVSGTGNYIYTESSGGAIGAGDILTPALYLDPLAPTVNLSFAYHMTGLAVDSLNVTILNGTSSVNIFGLVGSQQASINDAWITTTINLDSYIGDTVVIQFTGVNSGFAGDIAIDEVVIDTNSCPTPTNLTVNSITDVSVELGWTTGGATGWIVEYGAPGFTPGTGTPLQVTSNPVVISGLSPATDYCFFVRDSCGPGSFSDWITVCASTECSALTAPWSENFDGASWTTGLGAANNGNLIDPCWSRPSNLNPNFGTWTGPTASGNTGPGSDFSGSGKYIYTEASGAPGVGEINTPRIIIPSTMTAPRLVFYYYMYGAGIDSLNVNLDNGTSFTNIFALGGQQQTAGTDAWLQASIDLSAYIGDTISLRFLGTNSNFAGDIAIDEISVDDISCPDPSNLQVTATTGSSITIDWTTGGSAQWQVGYRILGSGSPYTIVAAANNPFTINGLAGGSTYEIRVRDSCGAGDVSEWIGPETGNTVCSGVTAPWSEDFDTGSWSEGTGAQNGGDEIDACWIRPTNTGFRWGTGTAATPSANTGPQNDFIGSGNYLYIEASNGNGTASIESPQIFIDSQLQNPRLKFSYHFYGAAITSFTIEADDGTGYQTLTTITGQVQSSSAAPWLSDSVSLAAYTDDTIRLRFTGVVANFQGDMAIDQLSIIGNLQPCLPPTQMSFANVSTTSADIAWTGGTGSSEVEVVLGGQAQGTGTLYPNAVSPLSLTNLMPGTAYDVYIREDCGSLFSTYTDSTFTTLICPLVQVGFTNQNNLLQVNFNSASTVGADSLFWTFGDGNSAVGANPSNVYALPGNYTVTLIGLNLCGNIDTVIQNIQVCDSLVADFTFTTAGDTVFLNSAGTFGASNYYWDLGDGNDTTGLLATHIYATPGTKVVQLIAVNLCGDSAVVTKNIRICIPPIASWTYNIISSGGSGMQVQFDASATQNANSYEWDFGDGNTAIGQVMPLHTYATPGLFYRVTLTVENDCNERDVSQFRLNQISLDELSVPQQVSLFPNPADNVFTIEWDLYNQQMLSLRITDLGGKEVQVIATPEQNTGSMAIDISNLPAGSYLVRVHTSAGQATYPLVVK